DRQLIIPYPITQEWALSADPLEWEAGGHSSPHATPLSVRFFNGDFPVPIGRHQQLEPRTRSPAARLTDDNAGKSEDLPDQEQAKTRIHPFPFLEYGLLLPVRDADPVIFVNDDKPVCLFVTRKAHGGDVPAMTEGIVHQVVEDLDQQGICKDLDPLTCSADGRCDIGR